MRVADDIHVADVRGDMVFLDAARDQYFCVARTHAVGLREVLVKGIPLKTLGEAELLEELVDAGMVIRTDGPESARLDGPSATAASDRYTSAVPTRQLRPKDIKKLLLARLLAWARLRYQRPAGWIASQGPHRRDAPSTAAADVIALADLFDRLRPWLPGRGCCLPSSLTLLEFLRLYGVRATLVFGVRTYPFEAHCWIEHEGVVLNDTLEHVHWFTPIVAA
jgi:hypothetical protein